MKLFDKITDWFFNEGKYKIKEIKEEIVVELPENAIMCEHCKSPILQHEKRVTKAKYKFHVKCYRYLKKKAKHTMFYGK